jgi:hypothetical protein
MWISRHLGIHLSTCKFNSSNKSFFFTRWSNRALKGTGLYKYPMWTFDFFIGRRALSVGRNMRKEGAICF